MDLFISNKNSQKYRIWPILFRRWWDIPEHDMPVQYTIPFVSLRGSSLLRWDKIMTRLPTRRPERTSGTLLHDQRLAWNISLDDESLGRDYWDLTRKREKHLIVMMAIPDECLFMMHDRIDNRFCALKSVRNFPVNRAKSSVMES